MKNNIISLSPETVRLLENFSNINGNLFIRSKESDSHGHRVTTVNNANSICGESIVAEVFPQDFGVWDLKKFLATLSLFQKPALEFSDNAAFVRIFESANPKRWVKYFLSQENLLHVLKKNIKMPNHVLEFSITSETLKQIRKAASTLQVNDLCITPGENNKEVQIKILNKSDSASQVDQTSDSYEICVDCSFTGTPKPFKFFIKMENLILLDGDYVVKMAEKGISEWNRSGQQILTYYIALDKDSSYG